MESVEEKGEILVKDVNMYVDETNLENEFESLFLSQFALLKKSFESRRISVYSANNKEEVYKIIDDFIEKRSYIKKISFSDGVTLYQLGLFDYMLDKYKNLNVLWPLRRSKSGHYYIYGERPKGRMSLPYDEYKEKFNLWYENIRDAHCSDLTIIGANAITLRGEIVSVDGLGNRVSSMIFGPKHVIVIVGKNKITTDLDAALNRVHNYAAPLTYIRHANKHYTKHENLPCVKLGRCVNCSNLESACMNTVIVRGQIHHHADRIHLIVVNKELGF